MWCGGGPVVRAGLHLVDTLTTGGPASLSAVLKKIVADRFRNLQFVLHDVSGIHQNEDEIVNNSCLMICHGILQLYSIQPYGYQQVFQLHFA